MVAGIDLDKMGFNFVESPVTAPDLAPRNDGVQLNITINPVGLALLREMSAETGISQAEIVRRGLAWLMNQWQAERRHLLALLQGLSEDEVRQGKEIFRHLPSGEIAEGEALCFDTNAKGNLLITVKRNGRSYTLFAGTAVRMQARENKVLLTFFRNKVVIEEGERPLPEGMVP